MERIAIVIILSLALVGCTSKYAGDIKDFGLVTTAASNNVKDIAEEMNKGTAEVQIRGATDRVINSRGKEQITFTMLEQINTKILTSKNTDDIRLLKESNALAEYSAALSKLATTDNTDEINKSLTSMGKSVESINNSYASIHKGKSDSSTDSDNKKIEQSFSVISSLSASLIDKKRSEVLKQIISGANDSVTVLCDSIYARLGSPRIAKHYADLYQTRVSDSMTDFNQHYTDFTYIEGYEKGQALMKDYGLYANVKQSIYDARTAILKVKIAHQKLYKLVNNDDLTSSDFINAVKDIQKYVDNYNDVKSSFSK